MSAFKRRTISPDPIADAEFAGLFWGEGNLDIVRQGPMLHNIAPRARMAMRADDLPLLEWARDRFGGNLSYRASTDSWCWQVTGRDALIEFLAVLKAGRLPAKKRREVEVMVEAVGLIKHPRGSSRALSQDVINRRFELKAKLRELKLKDAA